MDIAKWFTKKRNPKITLKQSDLKRHIKYIKKQLYKEIDGLIDDLYRNILYSRILPFEKDQEKKVKLKAEKEMAKFLSKKDENYIDKVIQKNEEIGLLGNDMEFFMKNNHLSPNSNILFSDFKESNE